MSLNAEERARTSRELRAHVEALGLSSEQIGARAGLAADEVDAVVAMTNGNPVDAWAVRDVLDAEAARQGVDAGGWSVLTDSARVQAQRWFRLRDVTAS